MGSGLSLLIVTARLLPVSDALTSWTIDIIGASVTAFPEFVVLRFLTGRSSLWSAMWIPVTVVAWLAASLATGWLLEGLLSMGADAALGPGAFDFIAVITGTQLISQAAFLGVGQGVLLAGFFAAKAAAVLWFAANVLAAILMFIVIDVRNSSPSNSDTSAIDQFLGSVLLAALYAAVTGVALVVISRRTTA